MTKLLQGDTIHLELQLDDGATNMFPQALLYNAAASLVATVNLTHVASGRYADDSQTMPNTAYIAATFVVYSDSGHTTLASYGRSLEVFDLETRLDATVSSRATETDMTTALSDLTTLLGDVGTSIPSAATIASTILATVNDANAPTNAQTVGQQLNILTSGVAAPGTVPQGDGPINLQDTGGTKTRIAGTQTGTTRTLTTLDGR